MKLRHIIAGVLVLMMMTGCVTTSTRTHPTLEEELLEVNTVVIAPPRVEIEFKKLVGENNRLEYQEERHTRPADDHRPRGVTAPRLSKSSSSTSKTQ